MTVHHFPPPSPKQLTDERNKTHGDFRIMATIAQQLIYTIYEPGSISEDPVIGHGIDMICTKLARIAAGDPRFPDHWDDIAGYAFKVAEYIRSGASPTDAPA